MTTSILWAGGEDIDFPNGNVPVVDTNSGRFRSTYSRCGVTTGAGASVNKSNSFPGGAVATCWLSARIYWTSNQTSQLLIGLGKNGVGSRKGLWLCSSAASNTRLAIGKYDDSSLTILATESGDSLPNNTLTKVDIKVTSFADTVNGNVKVYVNGASSAIIDYTGNLTVSGLATDLNAVMTAGHFDSTKILVASEIIVADADTRLLSLVTHYPSTSGDANQWDGDGYAGIDETSVSDEDNVYTNTADEDFQCALSNCPTGQFGVIGIVVTARACKSSDASIGTLELGVKSDGTVDVDAGRAVTTNWDTYKRIAHTINGSQLTTTLLDALQLDLQSET